MRKLIGVILILLLFAGSQAVWADEPVGRIVAFVGGVTIERPGLSEPIAAAEGIDIYTGDLLITGPTGRVKLLMIGNTVLAAGSDTQVRVTQVVYDTARRERRASYSLLVGKVRLLVMQLYDFQTIQEVTTPTLSAAGPEGYVLVAYEPMTHVSEVACLAGEIGVEGIGDHAGESRVLRERQMIAAWPDRPLPAQVPTEREWIDRLMNETQVVSGYEARQRLGNEESVQDDPRLASADGSVPSEEGLPAAEEGVGGAEFDAFRISGLQQDQIPAEDLPRPGHQPFTPERVGPSEGGAGSVRVSVTIRFPQNLLRRPQPRKK